MTSLGEKSRPVVFAGMVAALAAYVCVHSPLVIPVAGMFGRVWASPYFSSSQTILRGVTSLGVIIAIAAALVAADVVTRSFTGPSYDRRLAYAVTAFGFVVIPAAVVGVAAGWMGSALLRPPQGPLIAAVPALGVTAIGVMRGWRPAPVKIHVELRSGLLVALTAVAAFLLGTSAILGLVRPPTGFDALSYHAPMAVYFWHDGNVVSLLDRGGFAMAQPGAAELWLGLLLNGFGERVANLGQLPFALLGAAAVHAFSRRLGFGRGAATVAGVAFLIGPLVAVPVGIQVIDIIAAALMMSAIALACSPATSETPTRAAMIGLAAGLAVTVKLAVLPAAAALLMFVAITSIRASSVKRTNAVRVCLALAVAFAVTVAPWAARNAVRFGNPIYPAALPFFGRGLVVGDFQKKDTRFVPKAAAWPLYPLVESHSDESGLGALFLVGAAPGLLIALLQRRRRPLWLYAAVSLTSVAAWWRLTQHEPRHLLTMFGLTFGFLPWTLLMTRRPLRGRVAAVLVVAAVFSAIVTFDQVLLPRVGEPVERVQFYDEVWAVDPFVTGWNGGEPLLYNTGYASLSYAGDYPLLGPALARVLLTVDVDESTQSIVTAMKRHGARYAYVPASPTFQPVVEQKYAPQYFELAHVSAVTSGKRAGTKRYLFRLRDTSGASRGEAGPVEGVRR